MLHKRNYLVQAEEQFIFIYDALPESIKSGNTELNEHNYKNIIDNLSKVDNFKVKFIEKQFEVDFFLFLVYNFKFLINFS